MSSTVYPFDVVSLDEDTIRERGKIFEDGSAVYVGPKKYVHRNLPDIETHLAEIYNVRPRPSDVYVVGQPRSGTTMTQELIWLIVNNLDFETAKNKLLSERYLLEYSLHNRTIRDDKSQESVDVCKEADMLKKFFIMPFRERLSLTDGSKRFIKSHLALSMMAPDIVDTAKVVYVARDPRDVAVSRYHLWKLTKILKSDADFKFFWNLFMKDAIFQASPYFEHVKEAWNMRHHPNMLFLFYEDLVTNMSTEIAKICKFFNKSYTKSQIESLCEHMDFKNFQANSKVNLKQFIKLGIWRQNEQPFIRKGKIGGWREYFDEEMTEQAEAWIREQLKDTDLKYPQY